MKFIQALSLWMVLSGVVSAGDLPDIYSRLLERESSPGGDPAPSPGADTPSAPGSFPVRFDGDKTWWNAGYGDVWWHTNQMRDGMRFPFRTGSEPALEYRDGAMHPLNPVAPQAAPAASVEVVYFGAPWCSGCRNQKPIIERMKRAGVNVRIVNTDNSNEYSGPIPHTRIVVNGRVTHRWTGAVGEQTIRRALPSKGQDGTPVEAIRNALDLLPEPNDAFVDVGSADGRVLIAAWRKWGKRVVGIEIDPERAAESRLALAAAGVGDYEIIVGDAREIDLSRYGDVAYVYQFGTLLAELSDELDDFRAVVSYQHRVPGLASSQSGDFHVYRRPVERQAIGTWYGDEWLTPANYGAHALSCNCYPMCQYLQSDWIRQGWDGRTVGQAARGL